MANSVFLGPTVGPTTNASILPSADNTYDLGSASFQWRSLYIGTSVVAGSSATIGWSDIYASRAAAGVLGLNQDSTHGVRLNVTADDALGVQSRASGTGPAALRVYGSATKYMRVSHDGDDGFISSIGGGNVIVQGGVGSVLRLGAGAVNRWQISDTTGTLVPEGAYDVGETANRVANIYAVLGNFSGAVTTDSAITTAKTFATLPATPVAGQRSFITDSNTAVFGATAAAGGANAVPVTYDGANWIVG